MKDVTAYFAQSILGLMTLALLAGVAIGFVIFVGIPWTWPFIKAAILWSLT